MKALILGAWGTAGHVVALSLQEWGHDVTTYSRRFFPYCRNIQGNAQDSQQLKDILLSGNYDVVINCIGLLNQKADSQKASAVYVNSFLPHFLAETLKTTSTKLIHISTDCVFSGKDGCYFENSWPDAESFYGRSKALGEIDDSRNLTFRTSIVGPDLNPDGIGLFNWFMKQRGTISGYTKAIWTGVTTLTLARAMEAAITENLTGLYHLVNGAAISKYDLLNLFNRYIRNNSVMILPNEDFRIDKSLINNRKDFPIQVPSYETMVLEMKGWIESHRKLYPHYMTGELNGSNQAYDDCRDKA